MGNLIALPLQGQALKHGNSAFIDEKWNVYPNQWEALQKMEKLSAERLEELMLSWSVPLEGSQTEIENDSNADITKPWERSKQLHREDVSGKISITVHRRL